MQKIKNRSDAGQKLAAKLDFDQWKNALVLALPRGGVPVAYSIASELNLSWDVLLVKKIGAPNYPEFALGAVCETDEPLWNEWALERLGYEKDDLQSSVVKARRKLDEQRKKWRFDKTSADIEGRDILLVDDGLATGMTMKAAVQYLKNHNAKKIGIMVPISSRPAKEEISKNVDEFVCLHLPEPFSSVGLWYEDFTQVSDSTVSRLLRSNEPGTQHHIAPYEDEDILIPFEAGTLPGLLILPPSPSAVIIFAHGSGSSHKSPRNRQVADALNRAGYATVLFDLLTLEESKDRTNVFDIDLLAHRLLAATRWAQSHPRLKNLSTNYFGASTGAAAALVAAAKDRTVSSVVCRGGRPDLADRFLKEVRCPVFLVVGELDFGVIELNEKAHSQLKNSEIEYIQGAGHLFEEPGTLDAVSDKVVDWWKRTLSTTGGQRHAYRLGTADSLQPLLHRLAQARVVMLGESTHGTEEFYRLRKRISQRLIEDYNFSFIAVEGDWPDCYRINQFIQKADASSAAKVLKGFQRWPRWMWANEQTRELIEWMKGRKVGFYGLDVYSFYESLDYIKAMLQKQDSGWAQRVLESYECLERFDKNEISYARSAIRNPEGCEKEILANLRRILRLRLKETELSEEQLFDLRQNAKIIRNADTYYRSMLIGGAESWNVRDEHMMDTLDSLLNYHGEGSKAIVWAHNTHIGDYHATDMLKEGYINVGGLARERYGTENVALVGFGTYEGEVLAGKAWGAEPERMQVPPAKPGSYEDDLHQISKELEASEFYMLMDGQKEFETVKDHRAIGVVYQPQFERQGRNYVPTELSNRYDAFVFVDKTTSLSPLRGPVEKGALPETWPSGH